MDRRSRGSSYRLHDQESTRALQRLRTIALVDFIEEQVVLSAGKSDVEKIVSLHLFLKLMILPSTVQNFGRYQ
ncbi:hypothetical protein D3C75_1051340 [compost metagenome]